MQYKFTLLQDCVRAELSGRETVAETQEFIRAAMAEAAKHKCPRIFKAEQYRISEHFKQIAANPQVRVALLADAEELRAAHEYIEVLARQQGANVRAFRDEAQALEWLRAGVLQSQEKR